MKQLNYKAEMTIRVKETKQKPLLLFSWHSVSSHRMTHLTRPPLFSHLERLSLQCHRISPTLSTDLTETHPGEKLSIYSRRL